MLTPAQAESLIEAAIKNCDDMLPARYALYLYQTKIVCKPCRLMPRDAVVIATFPRSALAQGLWTWQWHEYSAIIVRLSKEIEICPIP